MGNHFGKYMYYNTDGQCSCVHWMQNYRILQFFLLYLIWSWCHWILKCLWIKILLGHPVCINLRIYAFTHANISFNAVIAIWQPPTMPASVLTLTTEVNQVLLIQLILALFIFILYSDFRTVFARWRLQPCFEILCVCCLPAVVPALWNSYRIWGQRTLVPCC